MLGHSRRPFRPGQLVKASHWIDVELELFSTPYVNVDDGDDTRIRTIGRLPLKGTAIVVATSGLDGVYVYVLGTAGGGWAPGAFLTILLDTVR